MSTHVPERTNDGMTPQWSSHPSADTPDDRHLGEFPPDAAYNSIVAMDHAEQVVMSAARKAADALSRYAHLLPPEAWTAHDAAAAWRLARSL